VRPGRRRVGVGDNVFTRVLVEISVPHVRPSRKKSLKM
jgi:hypothetical protein